MTGAVKMFSAAITGALQVRQSISFLTLKFTFQQYAEKIVQFKSALCYAKDKSLTKGRRPKRSGQREVLTKRRNVL